MSEPDQARLVGADGVTPLSAKKRDILGIVRAISGVVAAMAAASVPIVAALVVQSYTVAVKERDRNAQYIQIAIGILSEDPRNL